MITAFAVAAVASAAAALATAALLSKVLRRYGLVRPNFLGKTIPVGTGLALVPALLAGLAAWFISFADSGGIASYVVQPQALFFFALVIGMAALGFLDDAVGDRSDSGFRGHFKALASGKITTGAVKAIGGGLLALVYVFGTHWATDGAVSSRGVPQLFLDALLIGLWTNLLNLFDLRPGRAIKVFLAAMGTVLIIVIASSGTLPYVDQTGLTPYLSPGDLPVLVIWTAAAAALLFGDVRGKFMLGDSGSNVLGVAIGAALAGQLSLAPQLVMIFVIVVLHIYAEKRSITEFIAGNRTLRFLDELGRS